VTKLLDRKPDNYHVYFNTSAEVLEKLFERARVYVHLAKAEHYGVSALEAMTAGCVVLAHDSGGPREFVPRELLWGDLDELTAKIRLFTSDQSAWESWHQRCLSISEMYTYEAFEKDFLEALTR
jgi:glycosyltransferase involved in cell wall biosynthesis